LQHCASNPPSRLERRLPVAGTGSGDAHAFRPAAQGALVLLAAMLVRFARKPK
jgi:hypothetical protein